jgi:hypothetical protein
MITLHTTLNAWASKCHLLGGLSSIGHLLFAMRCGISGQGVHRNAAIQQPVFLWGLNSIASVQT